MPLYGILSITIHKGDNMSFVKVNTYEIQRIIDWLIEEERVAMEASHGDNSGYWFGRMCIAKEILKLIRD